MARRGPGPASARPASAAEVARLAGVSRSAVSRTFTDGASVSDQTRARVMAAAETLNYRVNLLARGISKEASRPVCLIGAAFGSPFHARLFDAITRALQQAGRMTMVINTAAGAGSARDALERALDYRAAATVVLSGSPPAGLVQAGVTAGQRMILINRADPVEGAVHLRTADQPAMAEAVHMLVRAGARRLAVASSTKGTPSLLGRERAFVEAAAAQGLDVAVFRGAGDAYAAGGAAARAMLAGPDRPEGVFCVNDMTAFGVMDAARQAFQLGIPEDLNVIGFDDVVEAGWGGYDLTTFAQPYAAIAQAIVEQLSLPVGAGGSTITLPASARWRGTVNPGR